jgi:hypothetical protein
MPTKDEMLSFAKSIEQIVKEKDLNYIDAVTHFCEINSLEIESVTNLINHSLKAKIAYDASQLNLLPKSNTLPV